MEHRDDELAAIGPEANEAEPLREEGVPFLMVVETLGAAAEWVMHRVFDS